MRNLSLIVNDVVIHTFPIPNSVTDDQVIDLDETLRAILLQIAEGKIAPDNVEICTTIEVPKE